MTRADSLKRTLFKEISILEPQHYLVVESGQVQKMRYDCLFNTYVLNSTNMCKDDMFQASD